MSEFVVDASVAAKWVLAGEPYEENAFRLKADNLSGEAGLHSPDIFRYEIGNVLWKASNKTRIKSEDALRALVAFSFMNIGLHPQSWDDVSNAFRISVALGITAYDAAYVHLSSRLKVPLLTLDEQLCRAAKSRCRIVHLKDY